GQGADLVAPANAGSDRATGGLTSGLVAAFHGADEPVDRHVNALPDEEDGAGEHRREGAGAEEREAAVDSLDRLAEISGVVDAHDVDDRAVPDDGGVSALEESALR